MPFQFHGWPGKSRVRTARIRSVSNALASGSSFFSVGPRGLASGFMVAKMKPYQISVFSCGSEVSARSWSSGQVRVISGAEASVPSRS
jgi:hypothetical protein